jgi:chorismate synthase
LNQIKDTNLVNIRCPHPDTGASFIQLINEVKLQKDSIGGIITCCVVGVPSGLGEPCFDKLPALLAHAMLSLPAVKGFEIGSGFEGTKMRGS